MERLKDAEILRVITIAILVYASLVVFGQLVALIGVYFADSKNVKINEDLAKESVVFPIYVLLPIFIAIVIYTTRDLLRKAYNYKITLFLAAFSIVYVAFGSYLYSFIQTFNS